MLRNNRYWIKLPLLLATSITISACSLFSSSRSSSVNSFLPDNDFIHGVESISVEEENVIGRAVAAKILSLYKVLPDQKTTSYVNLVGQTVAAGSERPDTFAGYSFAILDSSEVNAMAAPGGIIFISKGLLSKIQSEDGLAAVLAHEIVHVSEKHGLKAIKKEHSSSFVKVGGHAVSALDCSGLLQQTLLAFEGAVDDIVTSLLQSGYSREQEFTADKKALKLLERAGYDPHAMIETLTSISSESKGSGWFSTHPSAKDRIGEVRSEVADLAWVKKGVPARTERFKRHRKIV